MHDSATYTTSYTLRGNATNVCQGGACSVVNTIDKTGMVRLSTGPNGVMNALPTTDFWRYGTVPSAVQLNGVQTSLAYDGSLRLSATSGPEGTSTFGWDSMGRPTSKKGADGSEMKVSYRFTPGQAMVKEVSRKRWTETYMDGLGRPVRVQTGYGGVDLPRPGQQPPVQTARVVETLVDTRYAPCACNPFGKPYQVSRPRTSAGQPLVWTVTYYDALGRPTSTVHAPMSGSSGTTAYAYGNGMARRRARRCCERCCMTKRATVFRGCLPIRRGVRCRSSIRALRLPRTAGWVFRRR
ncbi:MAG: hypothetical protein SGI92_22930 [Bryobacteraceae bacterium]|nr:hypothetical protein [Bryobacteraceae bacterium]